MGMNDIPSAARRVAAHARYATGDMREVASDDLRTLLPVLDAVARSGDDAGRVERWARAIDPSLWDMLDGGDVDLLTIPEALRQSSLNRARAAFALADAERAAMSVALVALTLDERSIMARAMYVEACRRASCRSAYIFAGSRDDARETPDVWFDRLDVALGALAAARVLAGIVESTP